jgi:hypothetical protein
MLNSRTFAALYLFHFCVCCGSFLQVLVRVRPMSNSDATGHSSYGTCLRQDSAHTITWIGQPQTRFTFDHVAGEFITQVHLMMGCKILYKIPVLALCMLAKSSTRWQTYCIMCVIANLLKMPAFCVVCACKIF